MRLKERKKERNVYCLSHPVYGISVIATPADEAPWKGEAPGSHYSGKEELMDGLEPNPEAEAPSRPPQADFQLALERWWPWVWPPPDKSVPAVQRMLSHWTISLSSLPRKTTTAPATHQYLPGDFHPLLKSQGSQWTSLPNSISSHFFLQSKSQLTATAARILGLY